MKNKKYSLNFAIKKTNYLAEIKNMEIIEKGHLVYKMNNRQYRNTNSDSPTDINNIINIVGNNSFSSKEVRKLFDAIMENSSFITESTSSKIEYHLQACSRLELTSLAYFSDKLCTSPRTLCRRLRHDNTHFLRLVDNERKNRCRKLLDENILSGVTISHALGYSDPTYFYKKFRAWTGIRFKEAKLLLAENHGNIVHIFNLQDERVTIEL